MSDKHDLRHSPKRKRLGDDIDQGKKRKVTQEEVPDTAYVAPALGNPSLKRVDSMTADPTLPCFVHGNDAIKCETTSESARPQEFRVANYSLSPRDEASLFKDAIPQFSSLHSGLEIDEGLPESLDTFISNCITIPSTTPSIADENDKTPSDHHFVETGFDNAVTRIEGTTSNMARPDSHVGTPKIRIKLSYKRPKIILRMRQAGSKSRGKKRKGDRK